MNVVVAVVRGEVGVVGGTRCLVPLCQDTDEARLAVKTSSDVFWCDTRVVPCGSDGQAHLVLRGVSCACMQAVDACYGIAGGFMEARAVG